MPTPQCSNCSKPDEMLSSPKIPNPSGKNQQCYAHFRHHTKPKAVGGLTFVTVLDSEGTQKPLLDRDEIKDMLLEHSWLHFAAADGSTFMWEPLNWLLQYDGLTTFGDFVYEGKPLEEVHRFDEPTKAILRNLHNKVQPTNNDKHHLDYELLMNGIKNGQNAWPHPHLVTT